MPFGPFRGAVPENDIVVSDYIEDFMVAINKRKKAQTTSSNKGQRIASGGRPRQPQARTGDCRRAEATQTPESTRADKGGASPERDLEQTPESKNGQRIASVCGCSQTSESKHGHRIARARQCSVDRWEAKRQEVFCGVQERPAEVCPWLCPPHQRLCPLFIPPRLRVQPGSSGVQERSAGSAPTFDFRDSSPVV
jgi:hypothetical protein